MSTSEIQHVAEILAAHAVLLLGAGLAALGVSLAAVVLAVRAAVRFRHLLLRPFASLMRRLPGRGVPGTLAALARAHLPEAYVALHLVSGLLLALAVLAFAALAEEVLSGGQMAAFDVAFARALQDQRTPGWDRFFAVVTSLGSRAALALVTLIVAAVLAVKGRRLLALWWLAAQAGGGLLNLTLKAAFARTRPEFADPRLAASWSLHSGHAMGTFVLSGLAIYLLLRGRRSWTTSVAIAAVALSWCVTMAFSRLYLGVHFASDVIAGIAAGAAWVAVCVSALEVLASSRSGAARRGA